MVEGDESLSGCTSLGGPIQELDEHRSEQSLRQFDHQQGETTDTLCLHCLYGNHRQLVILKRTTQIIHSLTSIYFYTTAIEN